MYKVLIVEDEDMLRKGIRYTYHWNEADCVVVGEACNGAEGVEQIRALLPDIVITDMEMPLKSGLSMLEDTIEEFDYSAIILSVYDEFQMAKRAMELGVTEYLLKPLDYSKLTEALRHAQLQCEQRRIFRQRVENTRAEKTFSVLELDVKKLGESSARVKRMVEYVEKNYDKKISIDDLVQPLQTSNTYLNQKFRETCGMTFNEFLNRYRIQKAVERLRSEDCKIYMLAQEVGFRDYKYFISVFKKYTGETPSRFVQYFNK